MAQSGDEPVFTDTLALDMSTVEASLAGPKRPQDRVLLSQVPRTFDAFMDLTLKPVKEEKERLENEGGEVRLLKRDRPTCPMKMFLYD